MSVYIIPLLLIFLIIFGKAKNVNVYLAFCQGAKKSFELVLNIFPYIVAIMVAVTLFRVSGIAGGLVKILSPIFNFLGIPNEVCELVLLRPFSGSGSLSILQDIITQYGADSYISRCACCIFGSSETVFYVSSVYFADTKIKNVTPAIVISLVGNIVGAIFCCLFCRVM